MLKVTMDKINNRIFRLNHTTSNNSLINLNNIRLIDESSNIFFESNAIDKIKNWRGLSEDTNIAFDLALDTFDLLIENCKHDSSIKTVTEYLVNEISKVRNLASLKRSLTYRRNKTKHKISKIGRIFGVKKEGDLNLECYNKLIEMTNCLNECDRIIRNYTSLYPRFDVESVFSECASNKKDLYETIYTIASYTGTFNSPFINTYNTALETAWYGLNKNHISFDNKDIISAVTDYYIFNDAITESEINDIEKIKKITPIFESEDFKCIQYLSDIDQPQDETISKYDFDFYGFDGSKDYMDDVNNLSENKILEVNDQVDDKLLNDFKKLCATSNSININIMSFKALIYDYLNNEKHCPKYISKEFLQCIRMGFIMNPEISDKHIEIIIDSINKFINNIITTYSENIPKSIESLQSEYDYLNNKIETIKDDDFKSVVSNYINCLQKNIDKLNNQVQFLNKENEEIIEDSETNTTEDNTNEVSDEELSEATKIVFISKLLESIAEDVIDSDVDEIICGNIAKLSPDAIDSAIDFANTSPDIINKEVLREKLISEKDNIKEQNKLSISDYIKIDSINECIFKLDNSNNNIKRKYTLENCIAYLMCLDEIKKIDSSSDYRYFTEGMSFINTLKMSINNLKRSAMDLKEKERAASTELDNSIDNIIHGMEKEMTDRDREAIARGSILPSASKCIKIALTFAIAWAVSPALAVIGAIGTFFCRSKARNAERQLALDEIDVEIKMCERYIRQYEENGDLKAVRQCELIMKNLQRQQQRIKYRIKLDYRPGKGNGSLKNLPVSSDTGASNYSD